MASPDEIDKRKAILRARGVPERFIDNLARRRNPRFGYLMLPALLVSMAASMATFHFSPAIDTWLAPRFFPDSRDSLIFYMPVWPTMVLGLGAMCGVLYALFLYALISGARKPAPFPAYDSQAWILRTLRDGESVETVAPNAAYAALSGLADDQAFLAALRKPWTLKT